jgi:hypothetical protein
MSERTQPTLFRSRAGRVFAFVAIVWLVAGSFIALELILVHLTGLAILNPTFSGDLALPAATRESKTCVAGPADRSHGASPASGVHWGAWLMGLKLGRDALARQYASVDRQVLTQGQDDVAKLSQMLGVPQPPVFIPKHFADANTEFVRFVEADANQTARALAVQHSPDACHLYKLGAFWGYASLVRPSLPGERSVFAAEIRHYAQRAALPLSLWEPMVERTPGNATELEIASATGALTRAMTQHLER